MIVRRGVTRLVVLIGPYAIKLADPSYAWGVRGWLANRSEWRQRHRDDVARPIVTLGHLVLVLPRGEPVSNVFAEDDEFWRDWMSLTGYEGDEAKPSSWAMFNGETRPIAADTKLIDFDRAWNQHGRGFVGAVYYGRQERLARQWANLPDAEVVS